MKEYCVAKLCWELTYIIFLFYLNLFSPLLLISLEYSLCSKGHYGFQVNYHLWLGMQIIWTRIKFIMAFLIWSKMQRVLSVCSSFWNSKLIITLGKKQKRKNESSDEVSDAEQKPQHTSKDQDSQVSIKIFSRKLELSR